MLLQKLETFWEIYENPKAWTDKDVENINLMWLRTNANKLSGPNFAKFDTFLFRGKSLQAALSKIGVKRHLGTKNNVHIS